LENETENRIQRLENQIKTLEQWKAEKENQQISFPLDNQSIEILNKYFMRIYTEANVINNDDPGDPYLFLKYLGKQGSYIFDLNQSKFYEYIVNVSNNTLNVQEKAFKEGTRLFFTTTDTAPSPIDIGLSYYTINVSGLNFQITTISGDAGSIVDITDIGTGRQFIYSYIEP